MGRGEKEEISTMLFSESQPTFKNGISLVNSDTPEEGVHVKKNDLSSTGMVWPL